MPTPSHDQLLAVLSQHHIGRRNAISGKALAAQFGVGARTIRALVLKLREEAVAVCGRPETGYYIAATAEEVDATCKLLEAHGLHQLTVAARLRKTTLPELLGQMKLST
jgi:biotin operon repressor